MGSQSHIKYLHRLVSVAAFLFFNGSVLGALPIQSTNRVDWVKGRTVGPQLSFIPYRTNLLNFTNYGGTTNFHVTTGTIPVDGTELVVADASSYAIGHGIYISNTISSSYNQSAIVTNIVGNTLYLNQVFYFPGNTNAIVLHDNAPDDVV